MIPSTVRHSSAPPSRRIRLLLCWLLAAAWFIASGAGLWWLQWQAGTDGAFCRAFARPGDNP